MDTPECAGCRARDARIAELEQRIAALEARLGTNSTNSSIPPSANPLGAPKPVRKRKSKRQPGGQPGHPPRLKQLAPPERVNHVVPFVPAACEHCGAALPADPAPSDPQPTRFQHAELPPLVAFITEFQGHARTCRSCAHVTHAPIPREHLAHSVGPRFAGALSYFAGCHGVRKRGVE
jgi:transposase